MVSIGRLVERSSSVVGCALEGSRSVERSSSVGWLVIGVRDGLVERSSSARMARDQRSGHH